MSSTAETTPQADDNKALEAKQAKPKRKRNIKEKLGRPVSSEAHMKKMIRDNIKNLSSEQLHKVELYIARFVKKNEAAQPQQADIADNKENVEPMQQ